MHAVVARRRVTVADRTRVVLVAVITAFAALFANAPHAGAAASPAPRFVGQGTTYWEYSGNDGNGNLVVTFDTTQARLAPNEAEVTYAFDSGSQAFFVNSGRIIVTGSWATGWNAVTTAPDSQVHIGPFGDGTNIPFSVEGFLVIQAAGGDTAQGPWEVEGSFTPSTAF